MEHNISLDCREVYESLLKVLKKFSYLERCWSDAHDIEWITFYTGEHKHKVITVVLDDGDQFVFDEVIWYKSFTYIWYNNVQIQFDPVTYELIKDPDTERITPSDYTLFFTAAKVALDKIYELSHKTVTQEV